MQEREYFISKLTFRADDKLINDVFAYEYRGESLVPLETKDRSWLVDRFNSGFDISTLHRSLKNRTWIRGAKFSYVDGLFSWDKVLPKNITKRKAFISYYHHDDQSYKEVFKNLFSDLITHKSVEDDDIDSKNTDGYIKQLIQKEYLADVTVLIVLIGPNTRHRKHVDWEISGALNLKVGDRYAGLLGLLLPSHPDFNSNQYHHGNLPHRLSDNLRTGYAIIRDWTEDRVEMQKYIELAFNNRNNYPELIDNSRTQMTENTND